MAASIEINVAGGVLRERTLPSYAPDVVAAALGVWAVPLGKTIEKKRDRCRDRVCRAEVGGNDDRIVSAPFDFLRVLRTVGSDEIVVRRCLVRRAPGREGEGCERQRIDGIGGLRLDEAGARCEED